MLCEFLRIMIICLSLVIGEVLVLVAPPTCSNAAHCLIDSRLSDSHTVQQAFLYFPSILFAPGAVKQLDAVEFQFSKSNPFKSQSNTMAIIDEPPSEERNAFCNA